jgi:hypothetical protein
MTIKNFTAARALAALSAAFALFALLAPAAASDEVFKISNVTELKEFVRRVNYAYDGNGDDALDAELTADIKWNASVDGQWKPIGNLLNVTYKGTFDGKNHEISGLYAKYPGTGPLALFYGIGAGGAVKNLTLGVDFTTEGPVAGMAVNNAGTIERVVVYGSITCTSVSSSSSIGAGGSVISHCVNSANVTSAGAYVGGIAASFAGTMMKYCANHGAVTSAYISSNISIYTGGLAGNIPAAGNKLIIFSYNAGPVKAPDVTSSAGYARPGGLFGGFGFNPSYSLTVVNCFNYGGVSEKDGAPGAVIWGMASVAKTHIAKFANVYYLKASGRSLFTGGKANGTDGWGAENDDPEDPVKARIIEKSADEFANGGVLGLLNNFNDQTSPAYPYHETDAWVQGARYPILAEINVAQVDKSQLENAIAKAESLTNGAYTAASLAALTSALSAARDVLDNESLSLTQADVDKTTGALLAAAAALKAPEIVKIRSAADLAAFAARVGAGDYKLGAMLAADIEVESNWAAIGT